MIKSATAVKAKIKNKAGGNSDKSQIMLRIYLMERLLERVSLSKYRDNFVLKGGLLVSSLVGVDMRSTMDVDTTVKSLPLNKESAQRILEEIMAIDLEDGVAFRITKVQDIMEGHEYEGVRFMIECTMDKLKQTIKIDISTGDEITPRAIAYKLPLIIEDRSIDDVINKIADDGVMRQQWNNYRKTNYYVGDLEWDDVIGSAKILRKMIE
jgi:hypothetical protein